jgi:hypothetical protein
MINFFVSQQRTHHVSHRWLVPHDVQTLQSICSLSVPNLDRSQETQDIRSASAAASNLSEVSPVGAIKSMTVHACFLAIPAIAGIRLILQTWRQIFEYRI